MNQLNFISMKRINTFLFVTMAMLMLSVSSAWAGYAFVKLTAPNGTVSWIEIEGYFNDTNSNLIKSSDEVWNIPYVAVIDRNTKGSIDLNEVWSGSDGRGTHYQVTNIGNSAFSGCSGLTSVVIPSSVTVVVA